MNSSLRPLWLDLIHGALGFAVVSVAAFSVWAFAARAFRNLGGELGMYAAIAGVFLIFSGLLLAPLAGGMGRFYKAFLPAFLLYAVVWCVAWFALKNRAGEWVGAAAGCVVFAWVCMKMMGNTRGWIVAALALFGLHTAGYFAGDYAMYGYWVPLSREADVSKADKAQMLLWAKLSWGLLYGLGFGAGIGWVINRARVGA